MNNGRLLAAGLALATVALVVIGVIWPVDTAVYYAGGEQASLLGSAPTPQAAVNNLGTEVSLHEWRRAYSDLGNKAEFTESQFIHDFTGYALSLQTYASLASFDVHPRHESATDAEVEMDMHWSSVVGTYNNRRDLHVVKEGNRWVVDWPYVPEQHVPPQVIPVNYLRWDVITRGSEDDWGAQNVDAPHVKIVDMHPVNRAEGVVVLGELLNEDVIPAYVSVRSTLVGKNGAVLDTEGSFDMISHTLLPKQVTPFVIRFPGIDLSQVGSIRMEPDSQLISASADPVVEVENQQYKGPPGATLTGQVSNQSGQTVNVAHVMASFYDKNGQLVWVSGQYVPQALLPQTPVPFRITVPEDLARSVNTERTTVATYTSGSSL